MQFRMVVTGGYDGKWVWAQKAVLPVEWKTGLVYDSGVQITDIAQEGHQLLAHIKMMNHLRLEALKAQEDHQVEVSHLQEEKAIEVDRLIKEKAVKVGGLQEALKKEEQTLVGLKAALALEEERRKKVEAEITELKEQSPIKADPLPQVHKKDVVDYINNKHHLTEELERAKKLSSDKAWVLSAKIFSLKAKLHGANEKINRLKQSIVQSQSQEKYDWD
ncbi:hypothetical protein COCNU_scaffold009787G000010 [Cocos nucifera]|nr:hypothetical protein [Cocos nucifera]